MFVMANMANNNENRSFGGGTKFAKLDISKIGSIISSEACDKRNLSESCRNVYTSKAPKPFLELIKCCRCFLPREKRPSLFPHFRAMDPLAAARLQKLQMRPLSCRAIQ